MKEVKSFHTSVFRTDRLPYRTHTLQSSSVHSKYSNELESLEDLRFPMLQILKWQSCISFEEEMRE